MLTAPSFLTDTGALERSNPLPVGTYSVDLRNDQVPTFRNWQQGRSAVKVLKTNDDGQFSWILFSVSAPTIWASGIGFPSIANPSDERPQAFEPDKDPLDKISDTTKEGLDKILGIVRDPVNAVKPSLGTLVVLGLGAVTYIYRKDIFVNVKRKLRKYRPARSG